MKLGQYPRTVSAENRDLQVIFRLSRSVKVTGIGSRPFRPRPPPKMMKNADLGLPPPQKRGKRRMPLVFSLPPQLFSVTCVQLNTSRLHSPAFLRQAGSNGRGRIDLDRPPSHLHPTQFPALQALPHVSPGNPPGLGIHRLLCVRMLEPKSSGYNRPIRRRIRV